MRTRDRWQVRQDIIRAKIMNETLSDKYYDGKLKPIARAQNKKELSIFRLDPNPNVRLAAIIMVAELQKEINE